jgi:hypothetical protein
MNRALNVKPRLEIDRRVGLWQAYAMPYRFAARQPGNAGAAARARSTARQCQDAARRHVDPPRLNIAPFQPRLLRESPMNERICILFAAWIAVGVALFFGHPIGYTVILVGLASTIAIAAEDLRRQDRTEELRSAGAAQDAGQPVEAAVPLPVTRVPVSVAHVRVRRSQSIPPALSAGQCSD